MRRKWKDADVYLFFNEGAQPIDSAITLMSKGRIVERWNPQTGQVAPLQTTRSNGHPMLRLNLQPYEISVMVVR